MFPKNLIRFIPWLCRQFVNSAFFLDREHKAVIVNHSLGDKLLCAATDELIESHTPQEEGKIKLLADFRHTVEPPAAIIHVFPQ